MWHAKVILSLFEQSITEHNCVICYSHEVSYISVLILQRLFGIIVKLINEKTIILQNEIKYCMMIKIPP